MHTIHSSKFKKSLKKNCAPTQLTLPLCLKAWKITIDECLKVGCLLLEALYNPKSENKL